MVPFSRCGKWGAEQALSSPSQQRAGSWPGGMEGIQSPAPKWEREEGEKQGTEMPLTHQILGGEGIPGL